MKIQRLGIAVACILAVGAPVAAEVLVLRDGNRLETQGLWKDRGSLLVFTLLDGALSSIRLGDVDLEASHAASRAPEVPTPAPPPGRVQRESILVLTDGDVSGSTDEDSIADRRPLPGRGGSGARLEVDFWAEIEKGQSGLVIVGSLLNRGLTSERAYGVHVELRGREGEVTHSDLALLKDELLEPGGRSRFRAEFDAVGSRAGRPTFTVEKDQVRVLTPIGTDEG